MPEHVLDDRVVRDMPRAPTAPSLPSCFKTKGGLESFLQSRSVEPSTFVSDGDRRGCLIPDESKSKGPRKSGLRPPSPFRAAIFTNKKFFPRLAKAHWRGYYCVYYNLDDINPPSISLKNKQFPGITVDEPARVPNSFTERILAPKHSSGAPVCQILSASLHGLHLLNLTSSPPPTREVYLSAPKEFGSILGYPGEGPPRRSHSTPARPQHDRSATLHDPTAVKGREKAVSALEDWLSENGYFTLNELVLDVRNTDQVLATYVQHCYAGL